MLVGCKVSLGLKAYGLASAINGQQGVDNKTWLLIDIKEVDCRQVRFDKSSLVTLHFLLSWSID